MKYHEKAEYCSACLKPCGEFRFKDGDGVHVWTGVLSDCCHESLTTRREAMEDYVWKRGQREESRKRLEKINQLVDSLVADLKAMRPLKDPVQSALEQMLYTANEQYKFLNGR
jgi:hypothetical protein